LRIYLGAAPGVGKTYAMLNEGRRRRDRGTDVVVGFVESHGRGRTAEQIGDLEVVPPCLFPLEGSVVEEMDMDAVLRRRPQVALVDELAHQNANGARNSRRWRDIQELLDVGIDVISTLNIEHLESLSDVVEQITGRRQPETIPDEIVRCAEQVELVDMTPEALRRRMAHGNVYAPDRMDAALARYFQPRNLSALRELALLWVADRADEALRQDRDDHRIDRPWETRERVVVALTGSPSGERLIRRAARMAERSRGQLTGVHVRSTDGSGGDDGLLDRHRHLLEAVGGVYHEVVGNDIVTALVDFARRHDATQLLRGSTRRTRWAEMTHGSIINRVIRSSAGIDVHVISTGDAPARRLRSGARRRHSLPRRRRAAGWVVALAGTGGLTAVLTATRHTFSQGSQLLLYQALVVLAAAAGGAAPAVTAAILAAGALNWYFTPPTHTWTVEDSDNVVALVAFLIVGAFVGLLVTALARRTNDARQGRAEAETLAGVAASMVAAEDPVPAMLDRIRTTLGLAGAAVVDAAGAPLATSGVPPDPRHDPVIELKDAILVVQGALSRDDERVLQAFSAQLAAALERRRLRQAADEAAVLAEANTLRTALLRAVSHDLRTPLASIKASVTSLLQRDVVWSPVEEREFLDTIDEEADRLDRVVGNLLDASRLEAGALQPSNQAVALDEVVSSALASISGLRAAVEIDVPTTLPLVSGDPALLERAIANIVANADRVTTPPGVVRVRASHLGQEVQLRVIDSGPGIAGHQKAQLFQPFQRLGDRTAGEGVGLGLAVAKGATEAMGGDLASEDTPGGGLTMVITLRAADDDGA